MPNIAYPPHRPLSVGEVLDLTFRIYRATVVRCLLLAGLGLLAGQIWHLYMLARGMPVSNLQSTLKLLREPVIFTLYAAGALAQAVLLSAVLLREYRLITGPADGNDVAEATRRLPAVIGLGLLVALTLGAWLLPVFAGGVLRPLFALLALVAISYLMVALLPCQAILLTERAGPLASYRRSWKLTRGNFWRLSLIYSIAALILFAMYIGLGIVVAALAGIASRGDIAAITASQAVLGIALGALAWPFYAALSIAILGDLKVRREGTDIEQRIAASA